MTIENFLVHDESRSNPRTDVDLLTTRFVHRQENVLQPMQDDPPVADCSTLVNVVIAEIKTRQCALNGPWTNPGHQNMERVLRSIGCVPGGETPHAADSLYQTGKWSNSVATVRLFAVGEWRNETLLIDPEQQIVWSSLIDFCIGRFKSYERQKASNGQWTADGIRFRKMALRGDVRSIRAYFGLGPAQR